MVRRKASLPIAQRVNDRKRISAGGDGIAKNWRVAMAGSVLPCDGSPGVD